MWIHNVVIIVLPTVLSASFVLLQFLKKKKKPNKSNIPLNTTAGYKNNMNK